MFSNKRSHSALYLCGHIRNGQRKTIYLDTREMIIRKNRRRKHKHQVLFFCFWFGPSHCTASGFLAFLLLRPLFTSAHSSPEIVEILESNHFSSVLVFFFVSESKKEILLYNTTISSNQTKQDRSHQ